MYATFRGYNFDVKFNAVFNAFSSKDKLDDAEDEVFEMHDKALKNNDFEDCDKTSVDRQQKLNRGWTMKVYSTFTVNVTAPDYEEALDVAVGMVDEMELPAGLHLETFSFENYEMVCEPEYIYHEEWG